MRQPDMGRSNPVATFAGEALSRVIDPFVVFSFDRTGYAIHSLGFAPDALDVDLEGQRYAVTGANSGIGRATARGLAARGAEVVLLCRNRDRGEAAAEALRAETVNDRITAIQLDVSSADDIERASAQLADEPLHGLIHNAGVLPKARTTGASGLETTWATHVVGPYLLTRRLETPLRSAAGRVVFVSSGGMYTQRLEVDDPNWRRRPYDGVRAYAETKRAQVVLAELLAEAWHGIIAVNAMHPGWADTPAVASSLPGFHRVTQRILRTPEQGADTVLWLAASREAKGESGGFWFDRKRRATHWLPHTREALADRERLRARCIRDANTLSTRRAGTPALVRPHGEEHAQRRLVR